VPTSGVVPSEQATKTDINGVPTVVFQHVSFGALAGSGCAITFFFGNIHADTIAGCGPGSITREQFDRRPRPESGRAAREHEDAGRRRTVDIGPATARLIREQRLARTNNEERLPFPGPTGAAWDGHNVMQRAFKPAARAAGFPELTVHDYAPHGRVADRGRPPRQGDRRADGPR